MNHLINILQMKHLLCRIVFIFFLHSPFHHSLDCHGKSQKTQNHEISFNELIFHKTSLFFSCLFHKNIKYISPKIVLIIKTLFLASKQLFHSSRSLILSKQFFSYAPFSTRLNSFSPTCGDVTWEFSDLLLASFRRPYKYDNKQ